MDNPFVYGEAVAKEDFCDRTEEINKLKMDLINSQKVFLISPRKMGKTSLVNTVLEKLKKQGLITVFIDLEGFSSYKDFLDVYLLVLMRELTTIDKILSSLRNVLPGLRVDFRVDESGQPSVSLGYSHTDRELNRIATKIYSLPDVISKKRKKKVVIAFDEFQEILKLDGEQIEGILRGVVQHQRTVGYILAGSKKHLLLDMVNSPDRPFYKIGPLMYLNRIPKDEFFKFIKNKFTSTKIRISDEILWDIIRTGENIPYYVQMFCHELWDSCVLKKEIRPQDLRIVIDQLIAQQGQNYHMQWSRLILSKRRLLKAIAYHGGESVLSKDFLTTNELGYPSSVHRTLVSLIEDGYLDREDGKYFIADLLFREWIKKYVGKAG